MAEPQAVRGGAGGDAAAAGSIQRTHNPCCGCTAEEVVAKLGLVKHIEGGYFRETYRADETLAVSGLHETPRREGAVRSLETAIYYLLSDASPVSAWTRNRSPILNFFHGGKPVRFFLLHPDGRLETAIAGNNVLKGEQPQLLIPAGVWRASELCEGPGDWALMGEAVSPGFDYHDSNVDDDALLMQFPQHAELIRKYEKSTCCGRSGSS